MSLDRRSFLQLAAAAGVIAGSLESSPAAATPGRAPFKAVAFDAFPIFDPRPIAALAEALFPGRGMDLSNTWRTRQFEYQELFP